MVFDWRALLYIESVKALRKQTELDLPPRKLGTLPLYVKIKSLGSKYHQKRTSHYQHHFCKSSELADA